MAAPAAEPVVDSVAPDQAIARRPILVTGMHRSGTTWLGEMLAASGEVVVVQEPLNVRNRMTILRRGTPYWYQYITDKNEGEFIDAYRDAAALRPHPLWDLGRTRGGLLRNPLRIPHRWAIFLHGRLRGRRLLIKDPLAVLSLPWFTSRLGCDVVVTVRHPAAVVSSLKERGWRFDFRNLLAQPLLMEERLERFRPDMESAAAAPADIVLQGSLLWRIVYGLVLAQVGELEHVVVVRHEDLATEPEAQFEILYDTVGLAFVPGARRAVACGSRLADWRPRLTTDEVARIKELTAETWPSYYVEDDWA